jgi:antitoxin (DNA-binding transcriptional repressor) of toxin-antitoxin stability system
MGIISMREFNANISRVFARVDAGEEVIVTRQGKKPIRLAAAELPDEEVQKSRDIARLRELMQAGLGFDGPATYEERTGIDRLL